MVRRSFARFRRSSPRHRRGGVRPATDLTRWQYATFATEQVVPVANSWVFSTVELIKIRDHIGDSTTSVGTMLNQVARKIELGGVVFDMRHTPAQAPLAASSATLRIWEGLAICELDEVGNPVGVDTDYHLSMMPVAVSATAPANTIPDFAAVQRFLWRRFHGASIGANNATLPTIPTSVSGRMQSVRIRRSIGDRQGLYLLRGYLSTSGTSFTLNCSVAGTLYYRLRF